MSTQNELVLLQRHASNRDVRILLKNSPNKRYFQANNLPNKNEPSLSSTQSSADTDYELKYAYEEDYGETRRTDQQHKSKKSNFIKKIDMENFEIFLYNFNRIALGCYLKVMRAQLSFWNLYSLDENIAYETNFEAFKNLNPSKSDEKKLIYYLKDESFIENYIELIVCIHNKIVSKLYQILNNPLMRVNVSIKNSQVPEDSQSHIFRSFRILSLRHLKKKSKKHNSPKSDHSDFQHSFNPANASTDLIKQNFNELIDIRGSFDVRQFQNRTGYDCFIECEVNYFKILNTSHHNLQNQINKTKTNKYKKNLTDNKNVANPTNCWNEYLNTKLINQNNNAAFKFSDGDLSDLFLESISKKSSYQSFF